MARSSPGQFGTVGSAAAPEVTEFRSALYLATPEDMTAGPNEHRSFVTDGWQSAEAKTGRTEEVYQEWSRLRLVPRGPGWDYGVARRMKQLGVPVGGARQAGINEPFGRPFAGPMVLAERAWRDSVAADIHAPGSLNYRSAPSEEPTSKG